MKKFPSVALIVLFVLTSCEKEYQPPFDTTPIPQESPSSPQNPGPAPAPAPAPQVPAPAASGAIGFAAGTTGGGNALPQVVTTFTQLKAAAAASGPSVIHVKGTLRGTSGIKVTSNKTIVGLSGSVIEGGGFLVYAATNIIFKNLTVRNVTVSDAITIKDGTTRVWIDHCTFSGADFDGLVDITDGSDLITVSWSKFTGASKCSLVGGSYDNPRDIGKLRVTYHHNLFERNLERGPKVSVGTAHVFNNYYLESARSGTYNGYAIGAAAGAVVRAENNFFRNFHGNPLMDLKDDESEYGRFSAVGTNAMENSGSNKIRAASSNWAPSYDYKSVLIPAQNVPAAVLAGAGAK